MASKALEDYLKIIYKLEDKSSEKGVQTSVIAERLSISQASVSNMLKKLAEQDFISYEPYYGVSLTASGRKIALNMIRKHRILELYLVERLNYSWDEVDEEAEVLEHAVSDTLANRMWDDLGQPTHDPHGSPIPSVDGELVKQNLVPLIDIPLGQQVQVIRIKNRSPEELRYLANIGLTTGVSLTIKNMAPLNGPLLVEVEDKSLHAIDYRLAMALYVGEPKAKKANQK
ncbi:transcriptional regulator [Thiomicrorhabdus immobilis]|uniref:Transcriptional regulator MntR n=1 Tax=Thiomicrorhabdus immobilis TaxID=2791037 RepID=A0ABM7MDU9_9GAMM|nr:metal-dependent transcriptional regulator [Thiomicrorhabdus immobilis]BCN93594.1 transcriptional regulator [Thiomicrorhabdus immobilis]